MRQFSKYLSKNLGNSISTELLNLPVNVFVKDTKGVYVGCNEIFSNFLEFNTTSDIKGYSDKEL